MTLALVAGAVSVVALVLLLRPFLIPARPAPADVASPRDARGHLLRQVRDLDDDLQAGKLSAADHARLRRALEDELAPLLRAGSHAHPPATPGATQDAPSSPRPRRRWLLGIVAVGVAAGAVVAAGLVLGDAVHERPRPVAPVAAVPAGGAGQPNSFSSQPTEQQLAAVDEAVRQVRRHPGSVAAHLRLAHAYTTVDQPQLATVEYLATTRVAPGNPEANTALALVAFKSGSAEQAKTLVDRALETRPDYPEALYVRGLVQAMGLKRPAAAERDFRAYLEAAPFGSHRATVQTLLDMVQGGGGR